jgi:hypothetical protein
VNKDALLATLIGFGIGLLITGLLLIGPNILKFFPDIKMPSLSFMQSKTTPAPTPTPKAASFSIESPLPDAIESSSELLVSGTAAAGSTVVIAGPSDESVVAVKEDGKFAGKIKLVEGKNDITVTSLSSDKQTSQSVTVFYTEESL